VRVTVVATILWGLFVLNYIYGWVTPRMARFRQSSEQRLGGVSAKCAHAKAAADQNRRISVHNQLARDVVVVGSNSHYRTMPHTGGFLLNTLFTANREAHAVVHPARRDRKAAHRRKRSRT